jgi:hypothetical protein
MRRASPHRYAALFISPEVDPNRAITVGIEWILGQPGEQLILLHAKKMVDNNPLLGRAVRQYRIRYEAPQTIWKGRRWAGGPILAPWASGQVIRCIDDELSHLVTSVCMIGWTSDDPNHMAWIAAREAKDLLSGQKLGKRREGIVSDRVVRIALDHAANFINHNNALVQAEDKAYFVRTLQELVRGGHVYDLDEIATYAMATGWTGLEIKRIKEYGRRVLDEKSFRLEAGIGPRPGDCKRWEAEATGAK